MHSWYSKWLLTLLDIDITWGSTFKTRGSSWNLDFILHKTIFLDEIGSEISFADEVIEQCHG